MGITKYNIQILFLGLTLSLNTGMCAQEQLPTGYKGKKENLHIYLLIGQSNMAGRATITAAETGSIERCYLLNRENNWEEARNPLNRYSTIRKKTGMQKLNPGFSFAKSLLTQNKNVSIGLVVNAKGGTNIRSWKKGGTFYNEALKKITIARKTGLLRGIIWHQGESDEKDAHYLSKLKTLITDLRTDLNEPQLPFVAGQIKDSILINNQVAQLVKEVAHTGFASSQGLTTMDRWHFDTKSMLLLGQRYATEITRLQAHQQTKTASQGKSEAQRILLRASQEKNYKNRIKLLTKYKSKLLKLKRKKHPRKKEKKELEQFISKESIQKYMVLIDRELAFITKKIRVKNVIKYTKELNELKVFCKRSLEKNKEN